MSGVRFPGLALVLGLVAAVAPTSAAEETARNVILFLADAGGLPTLNAASWHAYGEAGKLFVQRMPHIALSDTSTASELVTDSAAGMTAIVTGQRTHNGVVGMGPDAVHTKKDGTPLTTILELAEQRGLATGFVSNDSFTGATPAALYAKVNDRDMTAAIFRQAFGRAGGDGVDVMIGSGRRGIARALSAEDTTIEQVARVAGRPVLDALGAVAADDSRAVVLLDDDEFDLAQAVAIARRLLAKNPRGYFLMVECDVHTDRVRHGVERMVMFDKVIAANAGATDTLLLFTADHSFDLRIVDGLRNEPVLHETTEQTGDGTSTRMPAVRMNDSHTGEEVLVAAQGPGSERVRGYLANTDLFDIMRAAFGWTMPVQR
jgi:alkaline phosphatase